MSKELKTVAYFIIARKLIKFQGDDDQYSVDEKALATIDLKKTPIKKETTVNVEIKEGVVTSIELAMGETVVPNEKKEADKPAETKQEAPKEEVKEEVKETEKVAPASSDSERVETIYAVSGNKTVVKFSKDGDWILVAVALQDKDYKEIGLVARNTVKLTFNAEGEITSCKSVESANKKEEKKEEKKASKSATTTYNANNNNSSVQQSIEAQACMNSACAIVAQLVGADVTKASASTINIMKRAIAKDSYDLLQELKAK